MSKKKVLLLIDNLHTGGAQRLLIDIAECLDRSQFDPVVCSLQVPTNYLAELEEKKIPYVSLGRKGFGISPFLQLVRTMKELKVDIVHTFLAGARVFGTVAARLAGVEKVFSHDVTGRGYQRQGWLIKNLFVPLDRMLMPLTEKIFAASKEVLEFNLGYKKLPRAKLNLLYNWIDVEACTVDPACTGAGLRETLGIPANHLIAGTVGRLDSIKGHRFLVEAAHILKKSNIPVCFVCIGDGDEKEDLLAQLEKLDIQDVVKFVGYVDDIKGCYTEFDLFVLPSVYDTFPLTILEAMAFELPVIATTVGGIPEMVSGDTGCLVAPRNAIELADVIAGLVKDRPRRTAMGSVARERVLRDFNRAESIKEIQRFYQGAG